MLQVLEFQFLSYSVHRNILPNCEDEQDRREYKFYNVVRNEDNSERDDDEAHQDDWRVEHESATDKFSVKTDKKRDEDNAHEPCKLDKQACRHLHEVVAWHYIAHNHNGYGKQHECYGKRYADFLLGKFLTLEIVLYFVEYVV